MGEQFKICLLKRGEFLQSDGERNVIKVVDHMPDVSISSNLEIDGELYHVVSTYGSQQMIGVRVFGFYEEVLEDVYEDNLTCPYCGYEDQDAFELEDEGVTSCGKCGSEMEYERVVEVKYTSTPKRKNEAIKIN